MYWGQMDSTTSRRTLMELMLLRQRQPGLMEGTTLLTATPAQVIQVLVGRLALYTQNSLP